MNIVCKCNGVAQTVEIPDQPFQVLIGPPEIKLEVPECLEITSDSTRKVMVEMSQAAWVHISTGPLFKTLFYDHLFADKKVVLPSELSVLLKDYPEGVIHGCGLIVLLVESMFEGVQKVYIAYPETYLHPGCQAGIVSTIKVIQQLANGPESLGGVFENQR